MARKYYISLEEDGKIYNLFVLGYDAAGGFFIKDLSLHKGRYFVTKMRLQLKGYGIQTIPVDPKNEWITNFKPKLIHHIDGLVQISETGIRSGLYKLTGQPKGVANRNVTLFNDGGPVWGFVCWGLSKFPRNKSKDLILFDTSTIHIDPHLRKIEIDDKQHSAHIFEAFYLPIGALRLVNLANGVIKFQHPNFGIIPLKYIPPPKNSPGFIALGHRLTITGFDTPHGITYGGGVSATDKYGYVTQIQLLFPFDDIRPDPGKKVPRSLDFTLKHKFISWIDDLGSKLREILSL